MLKKSYEGQVKRTFRNPGGSKRTFAQRFDSFRVELRVMRATPDVHLAPFNPIVIGKNLTSGNVPDKIFSLPVVKVYTVCRVSTRCHKRGTMQSVKNMLNCASRDIIVENLMSRGSQKRQMAGRTRCPSR